MFLQSGYLNCISNLACFDFDLPIPNGGQNSENQNKGWLFYSLTV